MDKTIIYILGYATPGSFEEVKRTPSKGEADDWVFRGCDQEGAMNAYRVEVITKKQYIEITVCVCLPIDDDFSKSRQLADAMVKAADGLGFPSLEIVGASSKTWQGVTY